MDTVQDLKNEMEVMKKTQTEGRLDMENLGDRSETTETSITNRIQEIDERISDAEDTIEKINALIKKNPANPTNSLHKTSRKSGIQ